MTKKQTAGQEQLGDFAPQFAHLNDDVLFGEVWSQEDELSAHDRSLVTIAALIAHDGVKHWHGATKDSWFSHLAITTGESEWLEPVTDEEYSKLS